MATQTTMELQDKLTGPLEKMMQIMDSTIRVMERMNEAANNIETGGFSNASKAIDGATAEMNRLAVTSSDTVNAVSAVTQGLDGMGGSVAGLSSTTNEILITTKALEKLNAVSQPDIKVGDVTTEMAKVTNATSNATEAFTKLDASITSTSSNANFSSNIGALSSMSSTANTTTKSMETLVSVTESASSTTVDMASHVNKLSDSLNAGAKATDNLANSGKGAADQQEDLNKKTEKGTINMKGYAAAILSAVGAYKLLGAAKNLLGDIFSQGINFHAFKEGSQVAFTTFLGNAKLAKQYMDDMYAFALTTPFAYPDLLESSRNLIAFGIEAKNTFPIMQAIGDAVAGIGGGNTEMQSMSDIFGMIQVQGKITMMEVNRLGKHGVNAIEMLATQAGVSGEAIKKQISDGAVGAGAALTGLVTGMDKQFGGLMAGVKGTWAGTIDSMKSSIRNAGTEMMEDFMEPFRRSIGNLTEMFKKIPEYIGPAIAAFLPFINMLNDAFEAGRFDGFFSTMSASLTVIAWLFSAVAEGALWVATVIDTFWPFIITALVLIASTYIPMVVAGLSTMVIWLYTVGRAWLVAMGPIGWIILAVTFLIGVINMFGVTTEQILGFVGALFFSLGAGIYNIVATAWNQFAMFAEFLANCLIDPTYAAKKLLYDMAKMGIDQMAALAGSFDKAADVLGQAFVTGANMAITAINWIIDALNLIPGVDIGKMSKISASSGSNFSSGLKMLANNLQAPTSEKNVVNIPRMDLKSIPGAVKSGYSAGASVKMPSLGGDTLDLPILDMPLLDMDNTAGGLADGKLKGGKLDKVGKIDDDVNIADEDLKMLSDLADIRSIQNFRSLQPSFVFGDLTIREDSDIQKIIKGIEDYMRDEMDRSGEGVYG